MKPVRHYTAGGGQPILTEAEAADIADRIDRDMTLTGVVLSDPLRDDFSPEPELAAATAVASNHVICRERDNEDCFAAPGCRCRKTAEAVLAAIKPFSDDPGPSTLTNEDRRWFEIANRVASNPELFFKKRDA